MSSYFQLIRRLKDSQFYIQQISNQFALWKATQDQVDNPIFKAYSRATTNRLIWRERAEAPVQRDAEFYQPGVPNEPGGTFPGAPAGSTITVMINFDHELEDRSGKRNHGIPEFTNNQWLIADGKDVGLSFAISFNPASNDTFDKLWIPFSPTSQILYDTPSGFSIFTRIMPYVITPLGTTASPTPQTNRIQYGGGIYLNQVNPQIVNIYWGTDWDSGSHLTRRNQLNQAIDAICASDHYKILWQYGGIKTPTRSVTHGNIHHNSDPPSDVSPNEAWIKLNELCDAGTIPDPNNFATATGTQYGNWDYSHTYCLHVQAGVTLGASGGFATWFRRGGALTAAFYFVIPFGTQGFDPWNELQMNEQGWAHECCHTLEGAASGGWTSSQHPLPDGTECGKRLMTLQGTSVGGRPVLTESMWSDMDGRCVAAGSGDNWTREPVNTGPIIRRYIFQKMDDLDHGATAAIGSDGTVYFNVKKAGIEYKIKSAAGAVVINQWADCWFVFNSTTNTAYMYINDIFHNTASTEALSWNNTHSHFILGNRNLGASLGQYRGRMDDFRLYRSGIVTATEVENLSNNGLSITGIEKTATQDVFVVNRIKIDSQLQNTGIFVTGDCDGADVPAPPTSFTTTSFTSTSFTL